jgi:DNA-binding winged helix-turn-helix (wHTH) protein
VASWPVTFAFGAFRFDPDKRVLHGGNQATELSELQSQVLVRLLQSAGSVVSKDTLIDTAWRGIAVTTNSVEQIISDLRRALQDDAKHATFIETVPRQGYRFAADVTREPRRISDDDIAALLEPYAAWEQGQAALDTLGRDAVVRAEEAFTGVVERAPEYAPAHRGLAHAYVLQFEATRADQTPNTIALTRARHHALEACRLDSQSAEAWATLAMVELRSGRTLPAVAAARRAVALEPDNWRHQLRLAYVAWGEERLRAAHRTLALFPHFGLAHWLAATVYVARQAPDRAEAELRAGAAAQDSQQTTDAFPSLGSHWVLGLVRLALGNADEAMCEFQRELEFEAAAQVFSRECIANTWCAIGALALRHGRCAEAASAFEGAIERVPGHLLALIGLLHTHDRMGATKLNAEVEQRIRQLTDAHFVVDAAVGRAALHRLNSNVEGAAAVLDEALSHASEGSDGWRIPIDPLLNVAASHAAFSSVLARLRARAA